MTLLLVLAQVSLGLALVPALFYLCNRWFFQPPPAPVSSRPAVSVLIPARNEEKSIGPAVESVLANVGVELEVIVLDDHSDDRTAEIVQSLGNFDSRVRLESAPLLPPGWCGKQHACHVLSKRARHPVLVFLDADVRLRPEALARSVAFLKTSKAGLVSGFPLQETVTLVEKLVIPFINWLLLCYLPMYAMRKSRAVGLGTGCGQWFVTTREAYDAVGGHAAVKATLHDGITLPRAYRRAGFYTDIFDATELASCRMYRSAGQVWIGLAKNAREGLGAPGLIFVWTVLLLGGHLLPPLMLLLGLDLAFDGLLARMTFETTESTREIGFWIALLGLAGSLLSLSTRLATAARFRSSWLGALLHPFGVTLLVAIQWYATIRVWLGRPIGWKGRPAPSHV